MGAGAAPPKCTTTSAFSVVAFVFVFPLLVFALVLAFLVLVLVGPITQGHCQTIAPSIRRGFEPMYVDVLLFDSAVIVKTHRKNKHLPYKHACDQKIKNV